MIALTTRRERKAAERRQLRDARIAELERWHESWRLRNDPDYRALRAAELAESRRRRGIKPLDIETHGLTVDERRRATRRMAEWARKG